MNFNLRCPACGERFMLVGFAFRHKCRPTTDSADKRDYMADLQYEMEHPEDPAPAKLFAPTPAPLPKLVAKSTSHTIADDEPARMYSYFRKLCVTHAHECGLCKAVAQQDLVCPDLEALRVLRSRWLVKSMLVATD